MSNRRITFVHTSPAALEPVKRFYATAAPEIEITNLLEDGLLRLLAAKNYELAQSRLGAMVAAAREAYGAELVMITCSSVTPAMVEKLRASHPLPILKIDDPMARRAVAAGRRIGVAVTFPPTIEPTTTLLRETAAAMGRPVDLITEVAPGAYDALLAGDTATHDAQLRQTIRSLVGQGVDAIVLAQVSMARIMDQLDNQCAVPVLTSLHTSLDAIRETLGQKVFDNPAGSA